MEIRKFGGTDMLVSVLGLGAAEVGFEHTPFEVVGRLLGEARDAGVNVIDTAECYVDSEELIGRALAAGRGRFYLFTKCGHPRSDSPVGDWRPQALLSSIERSLRRLQRDCLDLVQLHSCPEEELRWGDVITALQTARAKGYTRYIGYSGDGLAARYAIECGAFDALQTSVNIADQEALALTLPLARERGLGVIAKRPIANAVWRYDSEPANGYHKPYWERLRKLAYEFLSTDRVASVALRFTLGVPGVHTAIVGTAKLGRCSENAGLVKAGPLPADQFAAIRSRWQAAAETGWVGQV